jgi:predicted RecA/RadA family phage recombinase
MSWKHSVWRHKESGEGGNHCPGVWITLEATVASAIEAGVWAGVGAEVAVASTLVDTVNEGFVRDGVHALPKYGQPSNYPGR